MSFQTFLNLAYLILVVIISFVTIKVKTAFLEEKVKKLEDLYEIKEDIMGEMQVKLAEYRTQALTEAQARKMFVPKEEFKSEIRRLTDLYQNLDDKLDLIIKLLEKIGR